MPARRSRATVTERVVTASIWVLFGALVGLAFGLFFNSSVLLYLMIAVGLFVAWMVDRHVVASYIEPEDRRA